MKKFIRQDYMRHLRLGKKKKSLRTWRKPRGVHSKIRRKRFGYMCQPGIGYGTPREQSGKVAGLTPVLVHNVQEIKNVGKDSAIIIARVGAKNKMDIIKQAEQMKIKILNIGKGGSK